MQENQQLTNKKALENFGYYIIPFSINQCKYNKLKKRLKDLSTKGEKNKNQDKNRFKDCRYLFSYIKELYKNNIYYTIDLEAIKTSPNTNVEFINAAPIINATQKIKSIINAELPKLFPKIEKDNDKEIENKEAGKVEAPDNTNVEERFNATLEEISVSLIEKKKGYLIYKVNYNDMTLKEIEQFSYFFRRIANSTRNDSSFAKITCLLLGCKNYEYFKREKNDLTKPFYYTSFKNSFSCDVLQLITKNKPGNLDAHCFCLARGYESTDAYTEGLFENSSYDMNFSPTTNTNWVGSPGTLTCFKTSEPRNKYHIQANIENDCLCLYLTLLNQRYTLLSMMTKLVENKNKTQKLSKIYDELSKFKLIETFKVVSNEYVYQNIYERMYKILDIDNLIHDIDEISYTVKQQNSRNLENLFKAFTIVSSVATLYKIFDVLYPLWVQSQKTLEDAAYSEFCSQLNIIFLTISTTIILAILFIGIPSLIIKKK